MHSLNIWDSFSGGSLVKYIALLKYNLPKKDFNEPYDGIIYSLFLTMGFALVENISYVIGNEETGFSVAIARMFTAIPMHATCGIVMGYYLEVCQK